MPHHRGLTRHKFVKSVDHSLLKRYFKEKHPKAELPPHIIIDVEEVENFFADPRNAEAAALVEQDFRMINDICEKGQSTLVYVYRKNKIPWNERMSLQSMAMKLFLDHKHHFDYCYAWFCYRHASGSMSHHKMPGDFKPTKPKLNKFLAEIKDWFATLAKGRDAIVTHYNEKHSTVILIKHGSYIRTLSYWQGNGIQFFSFRPAYEDILFYDKEKNVLAVKARLPKERDRYLQCFARCIIGDESILTSADRDRIYSLAPVQNGTFNWSGNEKVKEVVLTRACLKIPGASEATIVISSEDVLKTLREDLAPLSLSRGELVSACFRFTLSIDNSNPCVSFLIKPPSVSDLSQKKHQEVINEFLEEQGVKLA